MKEVIRDADGTAWAYTTEPKSPPPRLPRPGLGCGRCGKPYEDTDFLVDQNGMFLYFRQHPNGALTPFCGPSCASAHDWTRP